MVSNLAQLAPLLQRLASLELRLDDATAAAGLSALQRLHSLRSLKLFPLPPARKLRLTFSALRLLPSSLTVLQLHFVPALGDDPLANMLPTVSFPNLRRLLLHFGVVPLRIKQAEPFQAMDALCPLLTWLKVVGPNPWTHDGSESDEEYEGPLTEETLSAQFLSRFPAIQTLEVAEGHVRDFRRALEDMPHLVAARLHLDLEFAIFNSEYIGETPMWLPVHQHLQVLQLNLRDFGHGEVWTREEAVKYDLSTMPNLIWAILIGPYVRSPLAIPRGLSKLLLVSNNSEDNTFDFQCDLNTLDLLALITVHQQCHVCPGDFLGPQLILHEGDRTCKAAFPSGARSSWHVQLL